MGNKYIQSSFFFPSTIAALCVAVVFLISAPGCETVVSESLPAYEAVSAELSDEIKKQETRLENEVMEEEDRDKVLRNLAKLKIAKQKVDQIIANLVNADLADNPIVAAGEGAKAVGAQLPPQIGVWVSLAGALIASIGRNVYQARRIKNARGAIAAVHANRQANGDANANFDELTSAIMKANMTEGQRAEVRKAEELVDRNLVDALNKVAAKKHN